ncbi:Dihydroneopterin aldolase 1 [Linum perenne]
MLQPAARSKLKKLRPLAAFDCFLSVLCIDITIYPFDYQLIISFVIVFPHYGFCRDALRVKIVHCLDPDDRISRLPDDILLHILCFMKIKDSTATSLLSRRWRYMCASLPRIDFDYFIIKDKSPDLSQKDQYSEFIKHGSKVIKSHKGFSLHKVHTGFLDQCVQFALSNKVQKLELDLNLPYGIYNPAEPYVFQAVALDKATDPSFDGFKLLKYLCLKSVMMANDVLEGGGVERLLFIVSMNKVPHLVKLSMSTSLKAADEIPLFSSCLFQLESLKLQLSYCFHHKPLEHNVLSMVSKLTKLKELEILCEPAMVKDLLLLIPLIEALQQLHKLVIRVFCVSLFPEWRTPEGMPASSSKSSEVERRVGALEHLKVLKFVGCRIGTTDKEIISYIANNAAALETIIIDPYFENESLLFLTRESARKFKESTLEAAKQWLEAMIPPGVELVIQALEQFDLHKLPTFDEILQIGMALDRSMDRETINGGVDKLVLRGMKFHGFHGVKKEERSLGQKFLVDVDAWMDLRPAGESDQLTDTINYADIYRIVEEVVEGPAQNLLESVAERIARTVLVKYSVISAVLVKIGKPHVAVRGDVDYLGVEILRRRDDDRPARS